MTAIRWRPVLLAFAAVAAGVLTAGCASEGGLERTAIAKVADVLAKPILGFAVEDATTTLELVKARGYPDAAKACPEAVLALDKYRAALLKDDAPAGKKGLIYFATVAKYGKQGAEDEAKKQLRQLLACADLIPIEKLLLP